MKRTRVKVCCIASIAEAELAVAHGADALGLVGKMPSGPGVIDDDLAREIARWSPPCVDTFLLSARLSGDGIAEHVADIGASTVQIVQHIDADEYPRIIKQVPHAKRVQVIHVEDRSALDLIEVYEPYVHAFLLDSGHPNAEVAVLGGTGCTHDWHISAEFVRRTSKPVFLAGGLNPSNVRQAIDVVAPYGLDICTGIRHNGQLDPTLLDEYTREIKR